MEGDEWLGDELVLDDILASWVNQEAQQTLDPSELAALHPEQPLPLSQALQATHAQQGAPFDMHPTPGTSGATECSSTPQSSTCWGAALSGSGEWCSPGFVLGTGHFKNKFCAQCRMRVDVPTSHIRALTPQLGAAFAVHHNQTAGFWKEAPPTHGGGMMRVVNNTMPCVGPWLVIYEQSPPELPWATLPADWVTGETVTLRVAKGTLVPLAALFRPPTRKRKSLHGSGGVAMASGADPACDDASITAAQRVEVGPRNDHESISEPSGAASDGVPSSSKRSSPVDGGGGSFSGSHGGSYSGSVSGGNGGGFAGDHSGHASHTILSARPSASPEAVPFVDEYILSQRHMASLIETRLSSDVELPEAERTHLLGQLELSRALLALVDHGGTANWRSLCRLRRGAVSAVSGTVEERACLLAADTGVDEMDEVGWSAELPAQPPAEPPAEPAAELEAWPDAWPDGPKWAHSSLGSQTPSPVLSPRSSQGDLPPLDDQHVLQLDAQPATTTTTTPGACSGEDSAARTPSGPGALASGGGASGLRVVAIASELDLGAGPLLEVRLSAMLLRSAGAHCTLCPSADACAARLDALLNGAQVVHFCGHADGRVGNRGRTIALTRGGVAELVDADDLTRIVASHARSLRLVVLNGCHSLSLGMRFVHAGVPAVACWGSKVADEAAMHFGIALSRALARGLGIARAYDAAIAAVLTVTRLSEDGAVWLPKFALVCPAAAQADPFSGVLPAGHAHEGRVAAGVPWLLCQPAPGALQRLPPLARCHQPRHSLERRLIAAIDEHRRRSMSFVAPNSETPRPVRGALIVLHGGRGHGKTTLAAWLARDVRTHSAFPGGVEWHRARLPTPPDLATEPAAHCATGAPLRRRRLIIVDDACEVPPLTLSADELLLVITHLPAVADAARGGTHSLVVGVPPIECDGIARGRSASDAGGPRMLGLLSPSALRPGGSPSVLHDPSVDSESTTWSSLVQLGVVVSAVACLIYTLDNHTHDVLAAPMAEPTSTAPDYPFPTWWPYTATFTPYLGLLATSPANEPLLRSLAEISIAWWVVLAAVNLGVAYNFYAGGLAYPGMLDAGLPSLLPALFHSACALLFVAHITHLCPALRARADALPFRVGLRRGMDQFMARHGRVVGSLLSLPLTGMPTSTYAYYLESAGYYRMPPAVLYLHTWKVLRALQVSYAALFLAYYGLVCAWTGGTLSSHLAWVPGTACCNLICEVASQPKNRRYIRGCLFPKQAQSVARMQSDAVRA